MRDEFRRLAITLPTTEEGHASAEASGKSLLVMGELCLSKLKKTKQLYDTLYYIESYYKNLSHDDADFNDLYKIMNELANSYNPVYE